MTHNVSSLRATPRRARWRDHCARATEILCGSLSPQDQQAYPAAVIAYRRWFDIADPAAAEALRAEADGRFSDALADVATAMAVLGFAVDNGWLYADELDSVRAYFAETAARAFVEGVLAEVQARPRPAPENVRSSC